MLLMSSHNICFFGKIRNKYLDIFGYPLLSQAKFWERQKRSNCLTLSMLCKNFSRWHLDFFLIFARKEWFDILCKLTHQETIWIKCQILFLGKIRKISSVCHLLNWRSTASVQVNEYTRKMMPLFLKEDQFSDRMLPPLDLKPSKIIGVI